jgi:hypothetical protein
MRHNIPKFSLALAVLALACSPGAAGEHTVPHKERGKGTLEDVGAGFLTFAGGGKATHFGKYTQTGGNEFDDMGQVLNGFFTTTAADGSTISGIYFGSYTVNDDGTVTFDVTALWLEGTGRFEGVTGEARVIAHLEGVFEGARYEYVTKGTLTFP